AGSDRAQQYLERSQEAQTSQRYIRGLMALQNAQDRVARFRLLLENIAPRPENPHDGRPVSVTFGGRYKAENAPLVIDHVRVSSPGVSRVLPADTGGMPALVIERVASRAEMLAVLGEPDVDAGDDDERVINNLRSPADHQ